MSDDFARKYPRLGALTDGAPTALLDVRLLAVLEGMLGRLDALEGDLALMRGLLYLANAPVAKCRCDDCTCVGISEVAREEARLDAEYCPDCSARHCCRANDHEREPSPAEIEARRRMDGT